MSITASGCRGSAPEAAALEPPPPLIEPELAPGSRLVDPRADELVRQMSERLARVGAFALEAEEVYDEVPEQSPRRQLTNLRRVAMRRPDRLVGDAAGDALNRSFWYDGKMFAALDSEQNVWASGAVPPTVDQALDWVFEQTGTVVPLADFLYADSYARLMGTCSVVSTWASTRRPACRATTCRSSRRPSTGRSGSMPERSHCPGSW